MGTGGTTGTYLGHLLETSEVSPQPLPEPLGVEARQVRVYQPLPLHGDAGPKLARRLLLGGQRLERRSAQLHPARQPCGGCCVWSAHDVRSGRVRVFSGKICELQ